jgi:hypothetical protein
MKDLISKAMKLLADRRWQGKSDEEKRAALKPAHDARKAKAEERRKQPS